MGLRRDRKSFMRFFTGMRTDTGSLDEVGRAPILDEGKAAHVAVAAYLVLVEATCGLGVRQVCDRPGSILALRQVVRRGRQADCPPAARGRGEPDPDGARSLRARAARGSQAGRRRGRARAERSLDGGERRSPSRSRGARRPPRRRGLAARSASAILQLATSAPIRRHSSSNGYVHASLTGRRSALGDVAGKRRGPSQRADTQ